MTRKAGKAHRASILVVDDDSKTRNLRVIMLSTHGYEVDCVSSAQARLSWEESRPDLVLVAFTRCHSAMLEFLAEIKKVSPQQRVAFLNGGSLRLSPLFYNGELIRKAEGPGDFVEQVGALLATP